MKQVIWLILFCAFASCAFADDPKHDSSEPALADSLKKASNLLDEMFKDGAATETEPTDKQKAKIAEFAGTLQSVAEKFPLVPIGTKAGTGTWKPIMLNRAGKGLDCLRFRTPKGDACEMAWSFISKADSIESWYLIPVQGNSIPIFKNFFPLPPEKANESVSVIVQSAAAEALKPDTEYIIWFKFSGAQPLNLVTAINLLPKGSVENNAEAISKAVAVDDGIRQFNSSNDQK